MSHFDTNPRAFFDAVYQDIAPWDIGGMQPDLDALLDAFPPPSPVLDLGCGTGDHVFGIARRGVQTMGIDFVEGAIATAQKRAATMPPEVAALVSFEVGDAFHLSRDGRQFGAIVDSGFFHLFTQAQRDALVPEIAAALTKGGRYYMLAFAVEFDLPNTPHRVTEAEVRARFSADTGWRIHTLRPAQFHNRIAATPAIAACIEKV